MNEQKHFTQRRKVVGGAYVPVSGMYAATAISKGRIHSKMRNVCATRVKPRRTDARPAQDSGVPGIRAVHFRSNRTTQISPPGICFLSTVRPWDSLRDTGWTWFTLRAARTAQGMATEIVASAT